LLIKEGFYLSIEKSWAVIEEEIQSIPGNGPVLEELCRVLEAGEAIALVGAGASAGLWPLWNEFLRGFIAFSEKNGKISPAEAEFFQDEAPQTPLETAQQLRNKIGDHLYFEYLQETFGDKTSAQTGGAFTLTHQALLQLPIHNYLTLNYDAGLTNARAALYPKATTSYYFWDQEEARRVRDRHYKRQVLHAHGRYDRADSIILTLDDYRRAYDNRAFVRLLEEIFAFEKLLIVGFGLSDPYIKQLFNNISKDYKKSPLRHIALVGLDDRDLLVTHLLRERVEMLYGARILFYPTKNHHQALTSWLTVLAQKYAAVTGSQTAEEIQPLATPPQLKTSLPDKYIHQPTDDANYKGRVQDFATLNRWGNDPATRMIAVTGIGGQGKTSLAGRWLKQERSPELARMPVFYWSFYEDPDVGKFLEQVVEFCRPVVCVENRQEIEPISLILSVVKQDRLLLVLDGLEVLQEDAVGVTHGRINHPLLEQFLRQWLRFPHQGLIILTSRFRFPQLEPDSGIGFHHLNLVRLSREDGVALLAKLNIRGEQQLLETYVDRLYGHPLALRVLASTVKRCCFGDLTQFEGDPILTAAGDDDPLTQKLQHLLGFYERQLKNGQRELLGIISLFKRPVEIKSFLTLLGSMKSLESTPLAKAKAPEIEKQLDLLSDDFLIEKTPKGITTHPVIRDYFRTANQISGSRREVSDFLKARPGGKQPRNIEEVRDLMEAVQLLCDEGEFKAALDLRMSRLGGAGYGFNVFRDLPAITEGLECALAFVGDEARRQKVEKVLGKTIATFFCAGVSLYNHLLGNSAQALEWRNKCLEVHRQLQDKHYQAYDLNETSLIEMAMGNIRQARETVSQALSLSYETGNLNDLMAEFTHKAYYEFLLGNTSQAYQDFEIALYYEQDEQYLNSFSGNQQAEFLIRLQAWKQFEAMNAWNIQNCEKYHLNKDLAFYHLLQGWSEICRGHLSQTEKALAQAERILRPSGMVEYVCRLDWVWALLAEAKGEYQQGLQRVNDALRICADKGLRLWQADHFALRGRLYLQQYQKENRQNNDLLEKAGDDGHEALKIAEQTGYIWAKVEALELLAFYHQIRAALSGVNLQEEKESARRYANEAGGLKDGLFLTEEQMEELKDQARDEFER
jgi:hypothetical protein